MRNKRCWLLSGLVIVPFLFLGGNAQALLQEASPQAKLLEAADELIPVVVKIRGLSPKAPIAKGVKSREEIARAITEEADRKLDPGRLKAEGLVLRKLGLIPPDLDYGSFLVKLMIEQVGGYYDSETKSLYIAGWLQPDDQKPALVHELTHALQDQYFDLDGIMQSDRKLQNDDRSLAHLAIAEGDATGVMLDYILQPAGRTFEQLPDLVFIMRSQLMLMNNQFEVLKSAPDFMKETLLFPYGYGAAFMQKVRARNETWSAVDRIYKDLPSSTEQIIHPEKYLLTRDDPKSVQLDDPSAEMGTGWQAVYRNVLGEFSLFLLLKLNLPEEQARSAASGWGGDQLMLLEDGSGGRSALFLETVWDDASSAERFFGALSTWLQRRYPQAKKSNESANGFTLNQGGECHSILRRENGVRLIVGLPGALNDRFNKR